MKDGGGKMLKYGREQKDFISIYSCYEALCNLGLHHFLLWFQAVQAETFNEMQYALYKTNPLWYLLDALGVLMRKQWY